MAGDGVYKRAGSPYWQIRWVGSDGREIRRSSGTEDYAEAIALREKLSASGLTFQDASVQFFDHKPMRGATRRNYQASLVRWHEYVGRLAMSEIDTSHIKKFVSDRQAAGVGSPAIRQDLAFLSSLFTYAQGLPQGPTTNPVRAYPKRHLSPPKERLRFLNSQDEAERLLSKLQGVQRLIVQVALETGMRSHEVRNLTRAEFDTANRLILLGADRNKGKRARAIPLSIRLTEQLAAHSATHSLPWVLANPRTGRPYYDTSPWFEEACAQAGLVDFRFHDLRHTYASWFLQRGGSLAALQRLLGHRSIQTTMRYAHLDLGHLRAEAARVSGDSY